MSAPDGSGDGTPDPGTPLFLDHNAGTPVDPRVLALFLAVEERCPGNPASVHAPGRRARAALEDARARTAAALGVDADEVVFCSGGTEADNLAVRGLGDPTLPVALAAVEHPAVFEAARDRGLVEWAVDRAGRTQLHEPDRPVGALALVHAQSEVGTIQPVVAAAELAAKMQVPLHVDAAQSLGRLPLDEVFAAAATVALSPHKAGGLRGAGVLIVRRRAAPLRPLLRGGAQEHGLRAGTVNPALAAATALAVELAVGERAARAERMAAARAAFVQALTAGRCSVDVLTPLQSSLPNTVMVCVRGVDGRALLPALDLGGVAASHGSACSSGSPQPPRVLAAMGVSPEDSRRCVRFSFARDHDAAFGARAGRRVDALLSRLQKKK
ncbi:MAG: cysteine desulfurase family protein [Planctomycetota bacterium]